MSDDATPDGAAIDSRIRDLRYRRGINQRDLADPPASTAAPSAGSSSATSRARAPRPSRRSPASCKRQDVAPSRCRTTLRRRVGDASTS